MRAHGPLLQEISDGPVLAAEFENAEKICPMWMDGNCRKTLESILQDGGKSGVDLAVLVNYSPTGDLNLENALERMSLD